MAQRLYVGNLPFQTSEDDLRGLFEKDGKEVADCRIIIDRETGRSRGFGFVEMATDDDARLMMESMDGYLLDGRPLKVNFAKEQEGGPRR